MESFFIALICSGVIYDNNYHTACVYGSQATSIQYGMKSTFSRADKKLAKAAVDNLGEPAILSLLGAYDLVQNRGVVQTFKNVVIAKTLTVTLQQDKVYFNLGWDF